MQKLKIGKFSIFNSFDVKLKFLMSWVELTQFSIESRLITSSQVLKFKSSTQLEKYQVELKFFWKSVELSWEVELKNLI